MKDPYQVLEIEKSADEKTIKSAFRKLALKYHPDKNPGNPEAEDRFKEISAAYEILGDPAKKHHYDAFGPTQQGPAQGQQYSRNVNINFEDILNGFGFEDILGSGYNGYGTKKNTKSVFKGDDLKYKLPVEFMDAIFGVKKTINIEYNIHCKQCNGTGAKNGTEFYSCKKCNGNGKIAMGNGFMRTVVACRECGGKGIKPNILCDGCGGSGQVKIQETITVSIPAAIDEGTCLRVSGKGMPGLNGGPRGDLYVLITIKPHEKFKRRGRDIFSEENISYLDALLGAKREHDTIHGIKTVTIPALTQPGAVLKLSGQGINQGDHFITINIKLPKQLSEVEERLLNEIKNNQ